MGVGVAVRLLVATALAVSILSLAPPVAAQGYVDVQVCIGPVVEGGCPHGTLEFAQVGVRDSTGREWVVPADYWGNAAFDGPAMGKALVTVEHPGFATTTSTELLRHYERVVVGSQPLQVRLQMALEDEAGRPLAETVFLTRVGEEWGPESQVTVRPGETPTLTAGYYRAEFAGRSVREVMVDGSPVTLTLAGGRVLRVEVRAPDGAPVPDAYVSGWGGDGEAAPQSPRTRYPADGMGRFEARADARGLAELHVPAGWLNLDVSADGFLPASASVERDQDAVKVELVRLPKPNVQVSGRVTDAETGEPVRSASFSIEYTDMAASYQGCWGQAYYYSEPYYGFEGDEGFYETIERRRPVADPDVCGVSADEEGVLSGQVFAGVAYVRTDAGGSCQECPSYYADVRTLEFVDGEPVVLDIELVPRPAGGARLTGQVSDDDGPASGVEVVWEPETGPRESAYTDEDGWYELDVPPGFGILSVYSPSGPGWRQSLLLEEGRSAQDAHVRGTLEPAWYPWDDGMTRYITPLDGAPEMSAPPTPTRVPQELDSGRRSTASETEGEPDVASAGSGLDWFSGLVVGVLALVVVGAVVLPIREYRQRRMR